MATNLTLSAADRNFDSTDASVLTDGGTIAVNNNFTLRIDGDTGYCRNAATPFSLTLNATSGGKAIIDGRDVWWVPYSSATGNVPAFTVFNTLTAPPDVQRSAVDVGAWLGFYAAMGEPPVLPGNPIPASGFLKLRYKTTTFAAADVLTFTGGSTVTLSGAGQRGWIAVQMEGLTATSNTITLPRLGDFKCEGDFFELGETKSEIQVNGNDINSTNNKIYFRQTGTNNYYVATIATGDYASGAAFATAVQTAINGATQQVGTSGAFPGTCTVTAGADDRLSFTFSASAFRFVGVGPICAGILGFDYFDQPSAIECLTGTGAGAGSTSAAANQLRVIRSGVGHTLTLTNAIAAGSAVAAEVNTRLRTLDPKFYCLWDNTNSRVNIHHPEPFTIDFTIANNPAAVMGYAAASLTSAVIHRVIGRINVATTGNTTSRAAANYLIGINDGADKLIDIGNNTSITNTALATAVQTALNTGSSGFSVYIAVAAGGPIIIERSSAFTLKWSVAKANSASRALGFNNDDSNDLATQVANAPYNFGAQNQTFDYFIKDVCPGIQIETGVGTGVYEWYTYVPRAPTPFYYNINAAFANTGRWANPTRTIVGTPTTVPTDTRGRCFSMLTTGSGLTIAGAVLTESNEIVLGYTDGINDCGYVPRIAGCKVRVPNIHLGCGYGRVISTFGFTQAADTALGTSTTAPGAVSNYVVAAASFNNYFPFFENGTNKMAVIAAATYTSSTLPTVLALALNLASNGYNTYSVTITTNIITITASQPFSINYLSNKAFIHSTTLATRPEFVTTSAGSMSMKKCASLWYLNLSAPFSVLLEDTSALQNINIANVANTTELTRVCVSPTYTDANSLSIASCFSGGTIADCVFSRYLFVTPNVQLTDSSGFTISGTRVKSFGLTATDARRATNTTATVVDGILINRCADTIISNCKLLYGRINVLSAIRTTVNNLQHAYSTLTNISANGPGTIYAISGNADTIYFEGLDSWDSSPYTWCYNDVVLAVNYSNFTMRNMGTAAAPLNMRGMTASFFSGSIGVNTDIRRIYMDNMRGNTPINLANTLQNVNMVNLWSVPNSSAFGSNSANGIDSVNNNVQGCRWTLGVSGQVACYGFHWTDFFISTTAGRVAVLCNEPLSSTASQCAVTAGTPAFNSNGAVAMPTIGDQITWTCPYYVLGYTAFANQAIGFTQSAANYTYEYQIDPGTGVYGIYKSLTQANLITETITAVTGFKLRIRATTATANAANTITRIQIAMTTNSTDQQIAYDLPFTGTGSITSIVSGSRLQIYNETKAIELVNTVVGATSYTYLYDPDTSASEDDVIRLRITQLGYLPYQARTIAAATSFGFLAEQQADSVYVTNAIDGSTIAECAADFVDNTIDITDGDDTTTVQRLYAFYRYAETLSAGIGDWFNGVLAVNTTTYVVSQAILDLTYNNLDTDPLRITGGRWTRADNSNIKFVSTNPIWTESITVSGMQAGSTLQIYNTTTTTELYNAVVGGTSYQYDFSIGTGVSTGNVIRIRVAKLGYLPFTTSGAATATETLFTASQVADSVYATNAVDGTTVTECAANFVDDTIEIDDPDDATTVQRIYAYYRVAEATTSGIASWFGAVTANSVSSYTINIAVVDLKWNNVNVPGVVITGGRWDRSNATSIAFGGSGPILMELGSVTSIVTGSRIQVYNVTTAAQIANSVIGGTSYTLNYQNGTGITAGDSIRIRLTLLGQLPYQSTVTATTSGFTLVAAQLADSVYTTNAIDGSTVSECTANYTDDTIEINDGDDSTSIQRIYAFYRYAETTSAGIADWHAGINAIDVNTYQIIVGNVDLTLNNTKVAALSLTLAGGRITRSNASSYIFGTSNAIRMEWGIISGIVTGSRIQIYNATTTTERANATVAGTSYSYNYNNGTEITSGNTVRIRLTLPGRLPFQTTAVATASGFTVTADQSALDAVYTSNGITGSTVTECAADYTDDTIDITDPDDTTTVQRIYAWYRYNETTSLGIASDWFNGMSAVDDANYLINVATIDLTLYNVNATPLLITNARLYRSDGTTVIFATSNSIHMDPDKVYAIATGGSALTAPESAVLLSLEGLKPLVIAGL